MSEYWIGFAVGFICFPFVYAALCYISYRIYCNLHGFKP